MRESLANLPAIEQKARDLCCAQEIFWFFAKNSFLFFVFLFRLSGGCPGVDSFIAKHTNTQAEHSVFEKTEEGKTKLLFDNGTSTTSARGFHWFSEFPLTPKKVFYFRSFSVVNDFFVAAACRAVYKHTLSWIWILKALENSLATHTPSSEWYQFRFSDRLQIGGVSRSARVFIFRAASATK